MSSAPGRALQNAQAVTIRFLYWQLESSVAAVTLAATAAGMLMAALFVLASRVRRWKRGPAAPSPAHPATLLGEPRSPAGPSSRREEESGPARPDPSSLKREAR